MQVALVHDHLMQTGGPEYVVASFHDIYPNAPLYTSFYDPKLAPSCFKTMDVHTSFLQSWLALCRRMPSLASALESRAFEKFDFSSYDIILSSSSNFAAGVMTRPETCHICYCHTPARLAFRQQDFSQRERGASNRVDYIIANSYNVARRIRALHGREAAAVIHPPVDTQKYAVAPAEEIGDHFLVVSRLLDDKRIDLAVKACNALGHPLRIVGVGPAMKALRKLAGPTIAFLGNLSDEQAAHEYARCRALILPGEEDFGITPLEAMASGRPVVAFGAGGALETIMDGGTGVFFQEPTADSLAAALRMAIGATFSPNVLRSHSMQFDSEVFRCKMMNFVEAVLEHERRDSPKPSIKTTQSPEAPDAGMEAA